MVGFRIAEVARSRPSFCRRKMYCHSVFFSANGDFEGGFQG